MARKKKRRTRYQTKAWMAKIRPKGKKRRRRKRKNPGTFPKLNRARRRRRSRARRNPKRTRSKVIKSVKRRGKPVSRAAWKASGYRRNPMAKRRKRSYRRRYRRNPPIIKTVQRGVTDAFAVVVGKGIARTVPTVLGLPTTGAVGIAVQALGAVAAGMLLRTLKLGGRDFERLAVAGGLAAPIESFIKGANIPFLSAALEGYGAYPQYAGALQAGELTDVFGTDVGSYPEYGY